MTPPSPPARHATGTGQLLGDVAGAVAVVTINNPGRRNALSSEIRAALPGLLEALQADGDVRAEVRMVVGAGAPFNRTRREAADVGRQYPGDAALHASGNYSAACRACAPRPARTSLPGSAPVCLPLSKIGVPAAIVIA